MQNLISNSVISMLLFLFLFFNCSENRFKIFPFINFSRFNKGEWSWNKHLEYAIPEDLPIVHPFVTRLTISIGNRKFSAMWKSCVLIELLQMYMCSEDGAGFQHSSGFCENYCEWCEKFWKIFARPFYRRHGKYKLFDFSQAKEPLIAAIFVRSAVWYEIFLLFSFYLTEKEINVLTVNPLSFVSLIEN